MNHTLRAEVERALLDQKAEIDRAGAHALEPNRRDPGDVKTDEDAQPLNEMNQAIASRRNRSTASWMPVRRERILIATNRRSRVSSALKTCPMPPLPIGVSSL